MINISATSPKPPVSKLRSITFQCLSSCPPTPTPGQWGVGKERGLWGQCEVGESQLHPMLIVPVGASYSVSLILSFLIYEMRVPTPTFQGCCNDKLSRWTLWQRVILLDYDRQKDKQIFRAAILSSRTATLQDISNDLRECSNISKDRCKFPWLAKINYL